jgi:hypothetical protein
VLNYHLYLRFCLFDIGIVLRVLEYILCSLFFFFDFVEPHFTPDIRGVRVTRSLDLCVMF